MLDPELDARLEYHRKLVRKYGFQSVSAATIYRSFGEIVRPDSLGFVAIRQGLYGRQVTHEVTHLLKLQAYKGASYSLRWGLSLAYVPHKWTPRPRWHRTVKSARFDLFEEPHGLLISGKTTWREEEQYWVDTLYGERCLRDGLARVWRMLQPTILTWFAGSCSSEEILSRAREQMARGWRTARHYPEPAMIVACILARTGRVIEGRQVLSQLVQETRESPDTYDGLLEAVLRCTGS